LLFALPSVLEGADSVLVEGRACRAKDSVGAGTGEEVDVETRDETLDRGLEVIRLRGLMVR
jgi:hypothetical protein